MTFSFYQSLRSVPNDMHEAATVYRFNWWQRFKWVELPFATMGLVWNSMMSMAGGWFFLMISEGLDIGKDHYWSPGIGSYIKKASSGPHWEWGAILWGVFAMTVMIVALDQLLWRPVVVWAQKFRVEEGGAQEATTSWFLDWLRRSRLVNGVGAWMAGLFREAFAGQCRRRRNEAGRSDPTGDRRRWSGFRAVCSSSCWGPAGLWRLVSACCLQDPRGSIGGSRRRRVWTLLRVLAATALGTLWALPAGLAIGLSPRLSRFCSRSCRCWPRSRRRCSFRW